MKTRIAVSLAGIGMLARNRTLGNEMGVGGKSMKSLSLGWTH